MTRLLIRLINGIITFAVTLALAAAGLYAGYALWDNRQIYSAAETTQLEMLRFKPRVVGENGEVAEAPSFEDLLAINPDVCAWVSMDNTAIDHPVLQGPSNLYYINTDVYGNFALAGSIFLDTRCDRSFLGNYNLLYGHHMDNHGMFGDLDLYKDEAFFNENQTGTLILPDGVYQLQTLACIVTEASDNAIFEPSEWQETISVQNEDGTVTLKVDIDPEATSSEKEVERMRSLMRYCSETAMYCNEETMTELENRLSAGEAPRILALSTCSSEYTNARTILLTLIES